MIDRRGDADLPATVLRLVHADDFAIALHPDRIGQRDLGRQGEGELDRRSLFGRRIHIEEDAARAYVFGLGIVAAVIQTDGKRKLQCEATSGALICLGGCHGDSHYAKGEFTRLR